MVARHGSDEPRSDTNCDVYWKLRLTQAEFIDGLVGAYDSHLTLAGWAKAVPDCPTPAGIWLSLDDPVDPKESDCEGTDEMP